MLWTRLSKKQLRGSSSSSQACQAGCPQHLPLLVIYLALGVLFGIILTKGEIASWFRIQEMLRFQSVHVGDFMGSTLWVAFLSVQLIKRLGLRLLSAVYALIGSGATVILALLSALAGTWFYGYLRLWLPH